MTNNRGKQDTSHSLKDLKRLKFAYVPPLDLPDLSSEVRLEELEQCGERAREAAKQINAWILSSMYLMDTVSGLSREAREIAEEKYDIPAIKQEFQKLLRHETPAYRRAAHLGRFRYEFARELATGSEVEALLARLVNEGVLIENPSGQIQAYKKTYLVSPECRFGDPEITELRTMLGNLANRVWRKVELERENKAQYLIQQATIGKEGFLAGKPGKYTISIPPEKVDRGGQTIWRGGGTLLLQSDGESAIPLDASGAIEAAIKEAIRLRTHLLVDSLQDDYPPSVGGTLSEENDEKRKKIQLLWHLLKRGLKALREEEEIEATREDLVSRSTISTEDFLVEKKAGACLISFEGTWLTPDGAHIKPLFFLIKREDGKIALVETPQHITPFLNECWGEWDEEEKFRGGPYPLNAILQAVYGTVVKAVKIA